MRRRWSRSTAPVVGEHLSPVLLAQAEPDRGASSRTSRTSTSSTGRRSSSSATTSSSPGPATSAGPAATTPTRRSWSTTRHHGKGIATLLLEHLAALARSNGIARFTAEVLADNRPMLAVFSRAGWPVERHFESGVVDLDFPLDETEEFLDSVERREQRADSRAMARLLLPRSIAVVGATDRPGSVGEALWRHVTGHGDGAGLRRQPAPRRRSPGAVRGPDLRADPGRRLARRRRRARPTQLAAVIEDCIASRVRGAGDRDVDRGDRRSTCRPGRPGPPLRRAHHRPGEHGRRHVATDRSACRRRWSRSTCPPGPSPSRCSRARSAPPCCGSPTSSAWASRGSSRSATRADVSGNDLLQFWEDDEATRVDRHVHRDVRQPAQVRPHRPAGVPAATDRGRAHRGGGDRPDRAGRCTSRPG